MIAITIVVSATTIALMVADLATTAIATVVVVAKAHAMKAHKAMIVTKLLSRRAQNQLAPSQ